MSKYIPEQQAIIDSTEPSIKVRAGAGSGKTYTLVGYADARPDKKMLYLAFNKAIQTEAESKFGKHVNCRTTHSIAYGAVGYKYKAKLAPYVKPMEVRELFNLPYLTSAQALNTINAWLCSADKEIDDTHAAKADVKPSFRAQVVRAARNIWAVMSDPKDTRVNIVHDGYLKLFQLSGEMLDEYDIILMDEAQDANPVTSAMIMAQRGNKVFVGDKNQSIYAFRGAGNAMEKIDAREYLLTSSFRFGQDIADVANTVLQYSLGDTVQMKGLGGRSVVTDAYPHGKYALLARTNGMLFGEAVKGLDERKKISIIGGPESLKLSLLMDAHALLTGNKGKIFNPNIKQFENFDEMESLAEETDDAELTSLCKATRKYGSRIPYLVTRIKNECVFTPKEAELILSTAHKAKGLEFDHVVIANDFKDPLDKDGIEIQEANLIYVVVTRAKKHLVLNEKMVAFINSPQKNVLLAAEKMKKFNRPT